LIVIDASALIELLLRTSDGVLISLRIGASGEPLHAPHLIDAETAHVLRRHVARKIISSERGREAINDLTNLSLRRHGQLALLSRVWELRDNVSAYDALYVALAEALDATLITHDRRLAAAANTRARIEAM
jgi:predicted nucleic acid-binding protein